MKIKDIILGLMLSLGKNEYSFSDLKYLTGPFKINESAIRTALSRLEKNKIINIHKTCKTAFYRLSDKLKIISNNVALSFTGLDWKNWDNRWIGAVFSVPDFEKASRHKIRKKLSAYRFSSLYPGFWIRPYNKDENLPEKLNNLKKNNYCTFIIFNYTEQPAQKRISKIWKLDKINYEFKKGINILLKEEEKIKTLTAEQALIKKIITGNKIVPILFADPLLPDSLLPVNWKSSELRNRFLSWDRRISEISRYFWINIFKKRSK